MPDPAGIYVHVPFCNAICNYCHFNRRLHDDALRQRYVDAVVAQPRDPRCPRRVPVEARTARP